MYQECMLTLARAYRALYPAGSMTLKTFDIYHALLAASESV